MLMLILLAAVNAKYIHSNPALYLLKAYADKERTRRGLSGLSPVRVAEYTINMPQEAILEAVLSQKPDVLIFSCYIWNREMIGSLLDDLFQVRPELPVFLGGPEATYDAEGFLENYPSVRAVMVGEGEGTFADLVTFLETGSRSLSTIPGLCLRRKEASGRAEEAVLSEKLATFRTGERSLLSMDDIPFPYADLTSFEDRIIYYEASRGCPYRCAYCLSSVEKKVRFRSLDLVKAELSFFLEKRVRQVKFIDRTFNADPKRCREIWHFLRENDNGLTNFHFEVAGDILTEEEIEEIKGMRPGLIQLEIGLQSTNEKTLSSVDRRTDLIRLKAAVERIRSFGNAHLHLDLIAGLPYEDLTSFRKSFNDVYVMRPTQLQLGFLKVLKGSPMETLAKEHDIRSCCRPSYEVLSTPWLTYDNIRELKAVEDMVERLYNSGQYTVTLPQLENCFEGPYDLYLSAAGYFRERSGKGKISRAAFAEAMLDFAVRSAVLGKQTALTEDQWRDFFRECLTCDFYLREKGKSRPAFAKDISAYKKACRSADEGGRLHAEVLTWELSGRPKRAEQPYLVTFDYEKRDPLTGNASMTRAGIKL